MSRSYKMWTEREYRDAKRFLAQGWSYQQIAARFGRSPDAVQKRLRADPTRFRTILHGDVVAPPSVPESVEADRDERAMLEPRSLTALICGDPLPGRSALDKLYSR